MGQFEDAAAELRRLHARVQELEAELEHESKWRDLALQFDNHRLHAKWHIQHLIQSGCGDAEIEHANDFLNKPPLSGEKVLAERLAKLQASQAQRVPLSDEAIAEIAERFEAIDPTDSFWVEVCRAFESASVSGITQEKQGMTHTTEQERPKREDFEQWSISTNQGYDLTRNQTGCMRTYEQDNTEHAWRGFFHGWLQAARRAPAAPVPQGWKLVPIEPTEDQLWCLYGRFVGQLTTEAKLYSDMLAAAPQPQAQEKQQ